MKVEVSLQLPAYGLASRYDRGEFRKTRTNVSLADRIVLISSIASEMKTRRSQEIFSRSLVNLNRVIDSSLIQSEELVTLVVGLEGKLDAKGWKDLLAKTRTFLGNNLEDLDDYRATTRFLKTFPAVFSAVEVQGLARSFPAFAQRFVWELSEDDPDELRTYAEEIGSIADEFGVSVVDVVNELEEKAQEEEDRVEREEKKELDSTPPRDFERRDPLDKLKRATSEVSDREIESMFSSLR